LGLTKQDDGTLVSQRSGAPVKRIGGDIRNFVQLDSIFQIYYFGDNPDNTKKKQIWIKTSSDGENVKILNPYVYWEESDQWLPLGAVYKDA